MKTSPACSSAPKKRGRPRKVQPIPTPASEGEARAAAGIRSEGHPDRVPWLMSLHAVWLWKRQQRKEAFHGV